MPPTVVRRASWEVLEQEPLSNPIIVCFTRKCASRVRHLHPKVAVLPYKRLGRWKVLQYDGWEEKHVWLVLKEPWNRGRLVHCFCKLAEWRRLNELILKRGRKYEGLWINWHHSPTGFKDGIHRLLGCTCGEVNSTQTGPTILGYLNPTGTSTF